ncbi:MAG TPA: hypothetical protein VFQ61_15525 [Polyangiaceae bacterium]|nr:hypothetical protein [Polyangiaceae bacterium]
MNVSWINGLWVRALGLVVLGMNGGCSVETEPEIQRSAVQCGNTLTCSSSEMCVVTEAIGPYVEQPNQFSCVPIPSACLGRDVCGCEDMDGAVQKPRIACSSERLRVGGVTCGSRSCEPSEYCLATYRAQGAAEPFERQCFATPAACQSDVCAAGCAEAIEQDHPGQVVWGCFTSPFAQAVRLGPG